MSARPQVYETIYLLEEREAGGEWGLADDAEPLYPLRVARRVARKWLAQARRAQQEPDPLPAGYEVRVATYKRVTTNERKSNRKAHHGKQAKQKSRHRSV